MLFLFWLSVGRKSKEDPKKWQRETTLHWVDQLVNVVRNEKVHVVFEGSTEIEFLKNGFHQNGFSDYKIILFDCSPQTMKRRLTARGQPELYHSDMLNWSDKLRADAARQHIQIIETDHQSVDEIGKIILELIIK